MRLRIDLAYDGTDYRGWATQKGFRTVQEELTTALTTALRVQPGEVSVVCAGRTDAGVHARGQVVHTDVHVEPPRSLGRRLNGILPEDIRVRSVTEAPPDFDARFGALWRRYAYRISDASVQLDPLTRHHVLVSDHVLDLDLLNEAAVVLLGQHDFASFCRRREGATTIRTLLELHWARDDAGVAVATVRADAFCHSMVRSLIGCLMPVGEGRKPVAWPGEILRATVRDASVVTAPAKGLTLEEVRYPDDADLRARADVTRNRRA